MNYGQELRSLRQKEELTMRKLEELSSVTAAQIANIENNKNNPTMNTFLALLNAMGYDLVIRKKA